MSHFLGYISLATMVAYVITGDTSIYEQQVPTRLDSPAHQQDYALPLLQNLKVRDALVREKASADRATIASSTTPLDEVRRILRERHVASVPIVDDGRLVGIITAVDLARMPPEHICEDGLLARQVMSRTVARTFPDDSLYSAWLRMSQLGFRQLAVVDREYPTRLLGLVSTDSIGQILRPASQPDHPDVGVPDGRTHGHATRLAVSDEGAMPSEEEEGAVDGDFARLAPSGDAEDPLL
jgi:CIC family chloride channel protein